MSQQEIQWGPIVSKDTVSDRAFQVLRNLIEKGEFVPGQKLPSENELADKLNISRISLRTALDRLANMGYVDRKRGVGTFVVGLSNKSLDTGIERLVSISQIMRERGNQPGTREIQIYGEHADEFIAHELRLQPGDPVTVIDRVRTMDGAPIMFDRSIFPVSLISSDTLPEKIGESLCEYIANHLHLTLTHSVAHLMPALADEFMAGKLNITRDSLLLKMVQTNYVKEIEKPVWLSMISCPENEFSWYVVRTA